MKLAVPDVISNSYFPAAAAIELGFFREEGLDVSLELIFPVDKAYAALRDGAVDFVGGSAHSALAAFPEWRGVKLLCAQGQGMYWFLVMHADLKPARGDIAIVKGKSIGAAPWVEMGLRRLLIEAGIDPVRDGVSIAPVPGAQGAGVNFGVTAAKALEERKIDGFWANGMGAEVAVRRGVGTIVLDVRRGDGPKPCFNYTMASIATTERLIANAPDAAAAAVRAIVKTQAALRADPERATAVGRKLFPPSEAALIAELIRRDVPYYDASISEDFVAGMNGFRARYRESSRATRIIKTWWRRSSHRSGSEASRRLQPVHAEKPVRVAPHGARHETGRCREGAEILHRIFVGPFGVDGFAFRERELPAADRDALRRRAHQINLDAPQKRVVERVMREAVTIEIRARFAIGAHQQVLVERRGHAGAIIIGRVQNARVLDEIDADKKPAAFEQSCAPYQELPRFLRFEISDRRAGKESDTPRGR